MKICIFCGSLEEGRDGVGDYCRLLAGALTRRGLKTAVAAIHDPYVAKVTSGVQSDGQTEVETIRIPSKIKLDGASEYVKNWFGESPPDILGLNYVPYAYNRKGMAWQLAAALGRLPNSPWFIMYHETWIGYGENDALKRRVTGLIQKLIIRKLNSRLRPFWQATSCRFYQTQLETVGVETSQLPIFSNIPNLRADKEKCREWLSKSLPEGLGGRKILGVFGKIPDDIDYSVVFQEIIDKQVGEKLALVTMGRNEKQSEKLFEDLGKAGLEIECHALGPHSTAEVSMFLTAIDLGLVMTAKDRLGKSGVYAALLDHEVECVFLQTKLHSKELSSEQIPNPSLDDIAQEVIDKIERSKAV